MIKDKNVVLSLGMFSLTFAILLGRYVDSTPLVSFIEGMLYGLSLVFNIFFLIKLRSTKNNS